MKTKFCEYCGNKVAIDAVICPKCGKQLEEFKVQKSNETPKVIINNNVNPNKTQKCDKWISLLLCIFLGILGAHKFYEGKIGLGILYIFTCGIFGIGIIVDLIVILCKTNPYYV